MPTENSPRKKTESVITRTLEAVAPTTVILWNPITNDGEVVFRVENIVIENDVTIGLVPNTELRTPARDGVPEIRRSISELVGRTVTVPTGEETTADVPLIMVMLALKKVFDELYGEEITAMNTPPLPIEYPAPPEGYREEMLARRRGRLGIPSEE